MENKQSAGNISFWLSFYLHNAKIKMISSTTEHRNVYATLPQLFKIHIFGFTRPIELMSGVKKRMTKKKTALVNGQGFHKIHKFIDRRAIT